MISDRDYDGVRVMRADAHVTTFRAVAPRLGGAVVMRIVSGPVDDPDALLDDALERFHDISEATSDVVVPVEAGWTDDGELFLTRRFVEWPSVRSLADSVDDALTVDDVVEIGHELVSILRTLHEHGTAHGALRPGNVFVERSRDHDEWAVVLADPSPTTRGWGPDDDIGQLLTLFDWMLAPLGAGLVLERRHVNDEPSPWTLDDIESALEGVVTHFDAPGRAAKALATLVVLAVVVTAGVLVWSAKSDRRPSVASPATITATSQAAVLGTATERADTSAGGPAPTADLAIRRWTSTVGPRSQRQLLVVVNVVNHSGRTISLPLADLRPVAVVGAVGGYSPPPGSDLAPTPLTATPADLGVTSAAGVEHLTALPMNPDGVTERFAPGGEGGEQVESFATRFPQVLLTDGASTPDRQPVSSEAVFYVPTGAEMLGVALLDRSDHAVAFVSTAQPEWTNQRVVEQESPVPTAPGQG